MCGDTQCQKTFSLKKIKKIKEDTNSLIKPTIILKGLQGYRKKENDVSV